MGEPTLAGLAALEPWPMTSTQVADLVKRTRRNSERAHADSRAVMCANMVRFRMPTTRARVVARYAMLVGCSLSEATRTVGQMLVSPPSETGVRVAWYAIYPDAPAPTRRRKAEQGRKAG